MNRQKTKMMVITLGTLGVFLAGLAGGLRFDQRGWSWQLPTVAQAADSYHTCPMHATIVQEGPGSCPVCGMDLVEKTVAKKSQPATQNSDQADTGQNITDPTDPASARMVRVDPVMVQNMGVRVVDAKRGTIVRKVRTIGEVEVAEDRVSVVNLRYSGWVEDIFADSTGQEVKSGQPLFSIYSPELVSAQKEFLLAYNTSGKNSELTKAASDRLLHWEIPRTVLEKVVATQNVTRTLVYRAPRSGYVLHKNVVRGARVQAGKDLFRIGNLKEIWVNAEVYEFDVPWIQVGQKATMELSFQRGKTFQGKVDYVYPTLNKKSRTLKVRLEFPNPGVALKPGMFATVRIEAQRKEDVLVIPTEAIIRSGERQIVFVTTTIGRYQPREIVTGLSGDDHTIEVLSGLKAGETVVTSGQFLLDSESQLQEAVQKLLQARLQANQARAQQSTHKHNHDPHDQAEASYWTCGMHPNIVQDGPGACPICGMDLVEKKR